MTASESRVLCTRWKNSSFLSNSLKNFALHNQIFKLNLHVLLIKGIFFFTLNAVELRLEYWPRRMNVTEQSVRYCHDLSITGIKSSAKWYNVSALTQTKGHWSYNKNTSRRLPKYWEMVRRELKWLQTTHKDGSEYSRGQRTTRRERGRTKRNRLAYSAWRKAMPVYRVQERSKWGARSLKSLC